MSIHYNQRQKYYAHYMKMCMKLNIEIELYINFTMQLYNSTKKLLEIHLNK